MPRSSSKSERKSSSRRRDRSSSPGDEELLRKAKDFVEKERKKSSSNVDDNGPSSSRRRSRSRSPDDDDDRAYKRHRSSRERKRRTDVSSEDEEDQARHRSRSQRKAGKHGKLCRTSSHGSIQKDDDVESFSSRDHKRHTSKDRRKEGRKHSKHNKHRKKEESRKDRKKEGKKHKREKNQKDEKTPKTQKPDKTKLFQLGAPPGKPPSQLLDADDDYFAFHQHLWVWLYREQGVAFNDLTSEESHQAFGRFVQQYNAGLLEAAYYDSKGLPNEALEECKTTRHKWTFQTSETERKGLQLLQDGVRKLTEYSIKDQDNDNKQRPDVRPASLVAPRNDKKDDENEDEDGRRRAWTAEERMAHRVSNKRLQHHVRNAEEELTGGRPDYGRERQLEKKKEVSSKLHGAARDREDAGMTISDDALYGDGGQGASFQVALARERKRKAQREESKQARMQELQEKEQNRQQAMLDMLGLAGIAPGQKIKIAPRNDGDAK
jgi:hypothetical protein